MLLPTRFVIGMMIALTNRKIYRNRHKVKLTNIAEIKYDISVQLQNEHNYAEIMLPIIEQQWSNLSTFQSNIKDPA